MPRITAPTVIEHREQQRRALLDAARAIISETRTAPTLAATAERAGLARSSIYRYFASSEQLLEAVVADVLPTWTDTVHSRVEAATTPGEKIWAYIGANLDLFSSSEQDLASALREVADRWKPSTPSCRSLSWQPWSSTASPVRIWWPRRSRGH